MKKLWRLFAVAIFISSCSSNIDGNNMDFSKFELKSSQVPIIFSPDYDITFWGLQKLHPFDSEKYGKIYHKLIERQIIRDGQAVPPGMPSEDFLELAHSRSYLESLNSSSTVATYLELGIVSWLPSSTVRKRVLNPMKLATGGTVMAGVIALEKGWAINLSGGYHHASYDLGGGFCIYSDVPLAIKFLRKENRIKKAMIIDLDAHQGNGHERDFLNDENVHILDIYNAMIWPNDIFAKKGIDQEVELASGTDDEVYLKVLSSNLTQAFSNFQPDIVFYNAGTDILINDPLGKMAITTRGIIKRDELVFKAAIERNIPIAMVLSGGYQEINSTVIADSIENLVNRFNLVR